MHRFSVTGNNVRQFIYSNERLVLRETGEKKLKVTKVNCSGVVVIEIEERFSGLLDFGKILKCNKSEFVEPQH